MIRTIPLNKLIPSPSNVRRSSDGQADLELKADIEARGLLQNLVVTSVRKPKGSFAVEAGGSGRSRRSQARAGSTPITKSAASSSRAVLRRPAKRASPRISSGLR